MNTFFKHNHFKVMLIFLAVLITFTFSCRQKTEIVSKTYRAEITPLNGSVTGKMPSGYASLKIQNDSLTIRVELSNLPPDMMHLQHFHGFTDGSDATCASMEQDQNNDGIVDLLETRNVSGVTLVPFHDDPASLAIKTHTYPVADQQGNVSYKQTLSLTKLTQNLQKTHNIEVPLFDNRVVYIHGINSDKSLPESVQSLPDVPANVTLPIACGKLKRVE
jgi:hypothetical protein